MVPRCIVGSGITGVAKYVLGEGRGAGNDNLAPEQESRVAWIGGQGFGFEIKTRSDANLAVRVMEFDALNQSSPTRKCVKDAVHLMLAWRVGDQATREEMEAAAKSALKALGMENARAIWTAHSDEPQAHLHIVASKINPETGRAYDLKGNYLKLSRWALAYEREHGGVVCVRRVEANALRDAIDSADPAAVLDALTRQRATFTAADLERALGKQIPGVLARAQFGNRVLEQTNVVKLADTPGGNVSRYTTQTVLQSEKRVLEAAAELAVDMRHGVSKRTREEVLASQAFAGMRLDQRDAFKRATGAEGLSLIDGQAGTGKSYTVAAIRLAYEASGRTVIGLAPTNVVARDMERDGFHRTATLHSELFALNNGRRQWNRQSVVVVDEAAMVDTALMATLTEHARAAGAKLVLVGDDRQLASIDRGGMFGALKDEMGAATLSGVTRQHKEEDRRAASMMAEGNFADALGIFDAKGAITWTRTQEQAREALVATWTKDSEEAAGKSRFVFAYTNADVAALNSDIRAVRRERGELGEDRMLPTADGPQAFAVGDRIQFTGTQKAQRLFNGMVGTIETIDGTRLGVNLGGRERVEFDAASFDKFRHGYAGTIYKGQGKTLDQTYLYHSEHWRSAASYVALTRHRDSAELFVATNTAANVATLARQMARVDERRAASQFSLPSDGRMPQTEERPIDTAGLPDAVGGEAVTSQAAKGNMMTPQEEELRRAAPAAMPLFETTEGRLEAGQKQAEDVAAHARIIERQADHPDEEVRLRDELNRRNQQQAEEAKKHEQDIRREQENAAANGDITDPVQRYAQALGTCYSSDNPYGSLAEAAMAEYEAFSKKQQQLNNAARAEEDPEKRQIIELQAKIEGADYMAITHRRLGSMSDVTAANEGSEQGDQHRDAAKIWKDFGNEWRNERTELLRQQQEYEQGQAREKTNEQERAGNGTSERTSSQQEDRGVERGDQAQASQRGSRETGDRHQDQTDSGSERPAQVRNPGGRGGMGL